MGSLCKLQLILWFCCLAGLENLENQLASCLLPFSCCYLSAEVCLVNVQIEGCF